MNYGKIVTYFESDEKLVELMQTLSVDYFDVIDDYNQQIVGGILTTTDELQKAKTQLTSIYASLQPIYSKALSLKKQKEYRYYAEEKEKSGEKFKDGATQILAKDAVRRYRDVRDILFGYLKAAESLIYDCKDRIEQNRNGYVKENGK